MASDWTSSGILPTAWAASVWKTTPRSWQNRPISAIGLIVPTSLLAAMIETSTVRSVIASATAWAETRPYSSQGTIVISQPLPRQPFDRVEDRLVLGGGRHQVVAAPDRRLRKPP